MYNCSLSDITTAMRPGLITGRYPERNDKEPGLLDNGLHLIQGALASLSSAHHGSLNKIVRQINAEEKQVISCSNAQLKRQTKILHQQFQTQGMNTELCIMAFALIREISARVMEKRHYDCQLMGGWVMLHGQLAEMATGEGKTLTATLAAATAAMAGIPVHVLTDNEYLVQRDAELMDPLYRSLGLSVSYVVESMTMEQRRAAYACDITYCTHNQVAFDYLRDRLLLGNDRSRLRLELESLYNDNSRKDQLLLRGLCFAIVDEADSVLIDEARTPLIITREIDSTAHHSAYIEALNLANKMRYNTDFTIDEAEKTILLTQTGQHKLKELKTELQEGPDQIRIREELVRQALHALYIMHKDQDYIVVDDKIVIIDAGTGRSMPDRSWEKGLHQMIEAKEGCPLTNNKEHIGRLTYQRFFKRYMHLGAMSGTAMEIQKELWSVYGLRVRQIPLHRPCLREKHSCNVHLETIDKWTEIITSVKKMQAIGRPVLIGTGSVADSELVSKKLTASGIRHQVLNARQSAKEAQIIAKAGNPRQVTVSTNMAGRGTDIPLGDGVAELGGLHVIAACRNDAKRIDRQLFGRCSRQGDPGSYQIILSLQDEWMLKHCPLPLLKIMHWLKANSLPFQHFINSNIIRYTQRRIERQHYLARCALLKHDRQAGRMLAFSGHME